MSHTLYYFMYVAHKSYCSYPRTNISGNWLNTGKDAIE